MKALRMGDWKLLLPASGKRELYNILADDLGYGDVQCLNPQRGKIKTPQLDKLAAQGMTFTDAHSSSSVCTPTRYGLLTGRYNWRTSLQSGVLSGYSKPLIAADRLTVPALLKQHGYTTACIGKWHLGYSKDWNKLPITDPLERGFDYHFGVPQNHNDDTRCFIENDDTRCFIENHDIVGRKPGEAFCIVKGKDFPEGLAEPRVYDQVGITLTKKAIGFIRDDAKRPFFLYFTPCVPHTHIAPAAEFRGTSQAGLLGDYIQEMDTHLGMIFRTLDELKLTDKTLIIFTSDNGGTPKDFKGTQDIKLNLASEAGGIREKFTSAKATAKALGHVTNGPWHGGKGEAFEGGHRVPFIAHWPGKIVPGTSSGHTFCLTDMLATAAELLSVKLPNNAGKDSFSILPILLGKPATGPQRKLTFLQGDTDDRVIAVRSGHWKLIETSDGKDKKAHQLYDLSIDPGETTDLSKTKPELVKELATALDKTRADGRTRP